MTASVQKLSPSLDEVIRTSKQLSAADRFKLAKTLLDSLLVDEGQELDNQQAIASIVDSDEDVARERAAFIALHPTLLEQFPGEYVAIHNGAVVDHDPEGLALSLRTYQAYPDEFVWIAPVTEQAMEEWVVRSPRFEIIGL